MDGKDVCRSGRGVLTGRLVKIEGDISGEPGRSVFVLADAADWPTGTALAGQTVIAAFNGGRRREAYEVKSVSRGGGETRVELARAPFFIDHRSRVSAKSVGTELRPNQFVGTETAKGGNVTRYLSGSHIVFPARKLVLTLENVTWSVNRSMRYRVREDVDMNTLVRPGDEFLIEPDWKDARVELTTVCGK